MLLVEDVVDTGLTLHFLARRSRSREPASLAAVTLLDRPYRRLVDDIPLRYVGFTVPDELLPATASGSTSAGGPAGPALRGGDVAAGGRYRRGVAL